MKKFTRLLSVCLGMAAFCCGVSAQTFTEGNYKFRVLDEESKTCELIGVLTPEESYVIPGLAGGYTVTQSATKAFQGDETVRSIKFPARFQSVGNYCFADCKNLETVDFSRALVSIGHYSFSGCTALRNFELPVNLESIGARAFLECNSLTEITIPKSTVSIGAAPFPSCASLLAIHVEEGNPVYKSVDGVLYKGNVNIVQVPAGLTEYNIPDGVDFVMIGAFWGCSKMTGPLVIPESVSDFGSQAFYHSGFTGEIVLPRKMRSLYTSVFEGCEGITSVVMPGITYVRDNAFTGCVNLRSLEFGETEFEGNFSADALKGLTDVPDVIIGSRVRTVASSFKNVIKAIPGFRNLTLGANVDTVGNRAFSLVEIENLHSLSLTPPVAYNESFTSSTLDNATLTVPEASIIDYATTLIWKDFQNYDLFNASDFTVGNLRFRVLDAGEMTCELTGTLTQFDTCDVPGGVYGYAVTRVADRAFEGDRTLNVIKFQPRLRRLGTHCFAGCDNLEKIDLARGLSAIGAYSFSGCKSLREIYLPSGLDSIGESAFLGCNSLREVNLPATITALGDSPFPACTSLQAINMEDGNAVYRSEDGVLYRSFSRIIQVPAGKSEYTFPAGIETVLPGAFRGCSKMTGTLQLPETVASIGTMAFCDAGFTGELVIPENLVSLGEAAFEGCMGFESVRCMAATPAAAFQNTFSAATYSDAELLVPEDALGVYAEAECWKEFKKIGSWKADESVELMQGSDEVITVAWYNLAGAQVSAPVDDAVRAVYVRVSVLSDGSRRVEKICR